MPVLVDSSKLTSERPTGCLRQPADHSKPNSQAPFLVGTQRPRLRAKHPSSASNHRFQRPDANPDPSTKLWPRPSTHPCWGLRSAGAFKIKVSATLAIRSEPSTLFEFPSIMDHCPVPLLTQPAPYSRLRIPPSCPSPVAPPRVCECSKALQHETQVQILDLSLRQRHICGVLGTFSERSVSHIKSQSRTGQDHYAVLRSADPLHLAQR